MERRIILHIGHAKTGTTTIQMALADSRVQLAGMGTLYPKTKLIRHNHRVLNPEIFGVKGMGNSLAIRMGEREDAVLQTSRGQWDSVLTQVKTSEPDTVILSSEGFFKELTPGPRGKLLSRLGVISNGQAQDHTEVFAYVRSPVSKFLSSLQQRMKGGTGTMEPQFDWKGKVIASYKETFGEALKLRVFDRRKLLNGDALADFLDWTGYSQIVDAGSAKQSNVSISGEAMSVFFRLGPKDKPANRPEMVRQKLLARTVKNLDQELPEPTRPQLFPKIAEYIMRLDSDLIELRDRHGLVFDDVDYTIAGKSDGISAPSLDNIEDICKFDVERRDLLEARVREELSKA